MLLARWLGLGSRFGNGNWSLGRGGGCRGCGRALARKLGSATQIPDQRPAAEDRDEGKKNQQDAEAGFHSGFYGDCQGLASGNCGFPLDPGGERAVGLVAEWQGVAGGAEFELWVIC